MKKQIKSGLAAILVAAQLLVPSLARAQNGASLTMIRDAEIEDLMWTITTPILNVANIDPQATTINLVGSDALNAFVAGGPNIFLFTGLLIRAESPEQVIGVLAHEIGHIAGAHGMRTRDFAEGLQVQTIITMLLGLAAAFASGQGGGAGAAVLGSSALAANQFLSFSRIQESAADQAGARYLDAIGVSAEGLRDFLAVLEKQEFLVVGQQSPYFRTHPVTRERITFIEEHVRNSPATGKTVSPELRHRFDMAKAKLIGFLWPKARALQVYPEDDTSMPGRYARAIAYYRVPEMDKALPLIDQLIAEEPENPYFHELKGQMLFENGRVAEALAPYETAVRLLPASALLRTQLAQVQLEADGAALSGPALANLKESARKDPYNGLTWHLLAVAYGRQGDIGMAALSIAEKALLHGDKNTAIEQAKRAQALLKNGSLDWLRAQAVEDEAEKLRDG